MEEAGISTNRLPATLCELSLTCPALGIADNCRLPILTGIKYTGVSLDSRHGMAIHVTADCPPGGARGGSMKSRAEFWETGKRMPQGGLVAVITKNKEGTSAPEMEVAIATLTMSASYFTIPGKRLTSRPKRFPSRQWPGWTPPPLQLRAPLHRRPNRLGGLPHLPDGRAPSG